MKKILKIIGFILLILFILIILLIILIKVVTHIDYKTLVLNDGTELKYYDKGEGTPFIIVHGFGGSTLGNMGLLRKIDKDVRTISFDQRGFGETKPSINANVHQSAKDIHELIEKLELDDVVLMGYSMGSHVVFSYIQQFGTEHLSKVIIGDMTPKLVNDDDWKYGLYQGWYKEEDFQKDLELIKNDYGYFYARLASEMIPQRKPTDIRDFTLTKDELIEKIAKELNTDTKTAKGFVNQNPSEELKELYYQYWKSMGEADYRDLLSSIDVPTCILYADPGSIYYEATAKYMLDRIPNSTSIVMKNATHGSLIEEYSNEILEFIK